MANYFDQIKGLEAEILSELAQIETEICAEKHDLPTLAMSLDRIEATASLLNHDSMSSLAETMARLVKSEIAKAPQFSQEIKQALLNNVELIRTWIAGEEKVSPDDINAGITRLKAYL